MIESIVTHEIAKAMNHLQFNEPCQHFYTKDGEVTPLTNNLRNTEILGEGCFTAPTYHQLDKWATDNHITFEINVKSGQLVNIIKC